MASSINIRSPGNKRHMELNLNGEMRYRVT